MRKKVAGWLLVGVVVLWVLSLLPRAVASEAQSALVNVAGKDVGVDVKQFTGPRQRSYWSFTWQHVDADQDSLCIDITVRPYGFGFNSITYRTSSPHKSLDDFPGVTEARWKQ